MTIGLWRGDARHPDATDQIAVAVDSGGTTARITLVAWQVDSAIATRTSAAGDSVEFEAVVHDDTLRLTGVLADHRWLGAVSMGKRHADVEMARVVPLEPAERRALIGTYRTESGRIVGIAPFSEFGERLMLIDYETGRIGPLVTVARDRTLALRPPSGRLPSRVVPRDDSRVQCSVPYSSCSSPRTRS